MTKFINCSCENANYKGYRQHNSPVNIELVRQVVKIRERYYPDNEGTPAIKFIFGEKDNIIWAYDKHQEKERNADYEKIVNNKFN